MAKTQKTLQILFVALAAAAILIVVLGETGVLDTGLAAGGNPNIEFGITSLMELLTLGCAFLALRLFKFGSVHRDLIARRHEALGKWGVIRLCILELPMVADTLLYYIYMNPTFGYMAIILALCLPFVWPSMSRCIDETSDRASESSESSESSELSEFSDGSESSKISSKS